MLTDLVMYLWVLDDGHRLWSSVDHGDGCGGGFGDFGSHEPVLEFLLAGHCSVEGVEVGNLEAGNGED